MASEEKEGNPRLLDGHKMEQQNLIRRVAHLPLVSSTCHLVSSVYTCTKETSPYVRSVCDVAERGVKTLTAAALCGAQPLVTRLEPQIATVNVYACRGLDTLEEKLPILQQPSQKGEIKTADTILDRVDPRDSSTLDQVVADTKELLSNKITGARIVVSGTVRGVNEAMSSGVSGMVTVAKVAVQGSLEITHSVMAGGVNSIMRSRVGEMAATSMDTMLGKSEELVDYYLPMTERELAEQATSTEGFETGPAEQLKQRKSYYLRLGSLSSKLRHRVFPRFLAKLKDVKGGTQEALGQLHQTLELIEYVKDGVDQRLQNGQEKLFQMWLVWSQMHAENGNSEMTTFRGLAQQVRLSCWRLLSQLQGLPASIQDKARLIWHAAEELNRSFSTDCSFEEVPNAVLAQNCRRIATARGSVDEIVDYVVQNVPLPWVVGPFAPSLVELPYGPGVEEKGEGEDPREKWGVESKKGAEGTSL